MSNGHPRFQQLVKPKRAIVHHYAIVISFFLLISYSQHSNIIPVSALSFCVMFRSMLVLPHSLPSLLLCYLVLAYTTGQRPFLGYMYANIVAK